MVWALFLNGEEEQTLMKISEQNNSFSILLCFQERQSK